MPISGADFPRPAEVKTYHVETYDRISPKTSGFEGKGKTVFITGGSAGIGYSICRAFAAAGVSKVVFTSRSPEPQAKAKADLNAAFPDLQVEAIVAELTDRDAMTAALKSAGPIDVLVLNAYATHTFTEPSVTISSLDMEKTFQANVVANWHLIHTYLNSTSAPAAASRTVIAVSSGSAHADVPFQVGYASSKAALSRMVEALAQEMKPEKDGVRLHSYSPGIIYTKGAQEGGFPKDALLWEDVNMSGDFAVWLAGKEAEFLHGRFVWAEWDVDDLISLKEKMENNPMYLRFGLVY